MRRQQKLQDTKIREDLTRPRLEKKKEAWGRGPHQEKVKETHQGKRPASGSPRGKQKIKKGPVTCGMAMRSVGEGSKKGEGQRGTPDVKNEGSF